jgi:hypothetical protein
LCSYGRFIGVIGCFEIRKYLLKENLFSNQKWKIKGMFEYNIYLGTKCPPVEILSNI